MSTIMKASEMCSRLAATVKSLVKIAVKSRPTTLKNVNPSGPLVILGNGPSLNDTIAGSLAFLKSVDTMAVNFACFAEVFYEIRPRYYVLADPLFFGDAHPRIAEFRRAMQSVDWPMTLLIPRQFKKQALTITGSNQHLNVMTYNFVGLEGFNAFERFVYSRGLGMPRPRNVLVPAVMNAAALGYQTIYIAGADHSWMKTINVDDQNHVISVQPHFYKDDSTEQRRVDTTYQGLRLHQVVESFAIAFKAYHLVRRYTDSRGISVVNVTPGSFIDAFDRGTLPER